MNLQAVTGTHEGIPPYGTCPTQTPTQTRSCMVLQMAHTEAHDLTEKGSQPLEAHSVRR